MKNFINNTKNKLNKMMISTKGNMECFISKSQRVLQNNAGESESTGSTVLIIGGIVIGALVIGLLVVLFKGTLWPMVTEATKKLFNI